VVAEGGEDRIDWDAAWRGLEARLRPTFRDRAAARGGQVLVAAAVTLTAALVATWCLERLVLQPLSRLPGP